MVWSKIPRMGSKFPQTGRLAVFVRITRNTSDFFQYSSETSSSECPRDWFLLLTAVQATSDAIRGFWIRPGFGWSKFYHSPLLGLLFCLHDKCWFMVLNATFNNISVISWWSVLLVEETREPGENHRLVASH